MNLQEIGSFLGGRNHSTIIYSYEKISKQVTTKEELITTLKHVEKLLKNKTHSHF
jgi:chromosomal replication initiation ATPase DnaA